MTKTEAAPKVGIGMPVFNGEQFISSALDSILGQSFADFELIISDNASTDGTERICREYAARDRRIRYLRQPANIGAAANFKAVLDEACSEYFMWAACDDVRSPDFIEVNLNFLTLNPEYVASTSPNGFDDHPLDQQELVKFALDGEKFERFLQFFDHCWLSHGIFYSLIRTDVLRGCGVIGQSFIAADWAVDLYLASMGKINRTKDGYALFGVKGISRGSSAYREFRNHLIEMLLPFYRLTRYAGELSDGFSFGQRVRIFAILMKLNLSVAFVQLRRTVFKS
ncbi:MAG: glycosyltransferase family A protein [Mariprofundaceae bacterium]|nr:glycosyltransferase family A protein [Mariprofundaceae bacterium]